MEIDQNTGSIFLKQYVFSKVEIDYYRMNQKRNAEKMFAKEGISFHEYYKYLIFQVHESFRIVGEFTKINNKTKSQIDKKLESSINWEQRQKHIASSREIPGRDDSGPFSHSRTSSHNTMELSKITQSSFTSRPSHQKKIKLYKARRKISPSKEKKSIWRRLSQSFNFSTKPDYQEYETISNLRFLRLNNLTLELAYYENRGVGKIDQVIDGFAFSREAVVNPEVFIKKLDIYEKSYYEFLFEKNQNRHINQFSILMKKNVKHDEEFKMGVFYCEDKICDLCGRKRSPFDFVYPVEVQHKKGDASMDPSKLDENSWMASILNVQAKSVFTLPCDFFGKDFKEKYITHLKSNFYFIFWFENLTQFIFFLKDFSIIFSLDFFLKKGINGIHMLCFREFLRSRSVKRLDDNISCFDQHKLKCLYCFQLISEKIKLVWVDKLLLNYDRYHVFLVDF